MSRRRLLGLLALTAVLAGVSVAVWSTKRHPDAAPAESATARASTPGAAETAQPAATDSVSPIAGKPHAALAESASPATAGGPAPADPGTAAVTEDTPPPIDEGTKHREELGRLLRDGYGTIPPLDLSDLDRSPQKRSVVEAFQTGAHPERLSMMAKRKPFDASAWRTSEAYRQEYLAVVEPGRAYDPAQPGPGTPALQRLSPKYQETVQGEPVTLAVQAPPHACVTFTSADGAAFVGNDLTTITVQAGAGGIATVELLPTSGVAGDCRVSAASPLASSVISFIVNTKLPPPQE